MSQNCSLPHRCLFTLLKVQKSFKLFVVTTRLTDIHDISNIFIREYKESVEEKSSYLDINDIYDVKTTFKLFHCPITLKNY